MLEQKIDSLIKERIFHRTVDQIYSEWKRRGLLQKTAHILGDVPQSLHHPLIYSFTNHVHKEKGVFIDIIGESVGVTEVSRKALAASSDFLWAISLMVDDIEDGDTVRAGQESCWVKFGKNTTVNAADSGLNSVVKHLSTTFKDKRVADSCWRYVTLGLNSIEEHKAMDLDTPKGLIVRNYERRCDFHGTFQLAIMLKELTGVQESKIQEAMVGLRHLNRAGQLINDLKDIIGGDLYNRSFSDIRNANPTVPIIEMLEALSKNESQALRNMFGRKFVTAEDRVLLGDIITQSQVTKRIMARITDSYTQALEVLGQVVDHDHFKWFQYWVKYKLEVLQSQLQ